MKFAILLAGHLRTYKRALPSFIEFIYKPLKTHGDVDIFISTWNTISHNCSWQGGLNNRQDESQINIDDAIKTYGATDIVIENFEEMKSQFKTMNFIDPQPDIVDTRRQNNGILNYIPMWYKTFHCNQLKCKHEEIHQFNYDLVIKTRPDLLYPHSLDVQKILELKSNDTLFIGKEPYFTENSQYSYENGWNLRDMFAAGTSEVMDAYCQLYIDLKWLFAHGLYSECPERILWNHMKENYNFNLISVYEDTPVLR